MGRAEFTAALVRAAVSAVVLVSAAAVPAAAQQRWVSFGDSLSDRGNLFAVTGGTQPPPAGGYANGRFSNGLIWLDLIAPTQGLFALGASPAGNINYAFGGSRTDTLATPGPGTATQVGAFLGAGGTFAATDIATIWAGANNIFQGIAVPANQNPAAMSAIATSAAGNVATQVGQLAGAGARTILVMNLPDIGLAPQFNTSPASGLATLSTQTFNSVLSTQLAAVAAANPNARILQVNIGSLFSAVTANPAAFGFTNITTSCQGAGAFPACTGYLFFDGVHPTQAGYSFVAQSVAQYLNAPTRAAAAAAITEVGLANRRASGYRALERLGDYQPRADKTDMYVSIIGDQSTVGSRGAAPGYSFGAGGLEVGVIRHISPAISLGVALAVETGSATVNAASGNKTSFDPTSFAADFTARWISGPTFVQGSLGGGLTRATSFERTLGIGNLTNTAEALTGSFSAIVQAGYNHQIGTITLTPSVKFGYLYSGTGAFNENGAIAPLHYDGRSISTLVAAGEIKAKMALTETVTGYVLVGYEGYFAQSGGTLKGSIADSPGSTFATTVGKLEMPGVQYGLGLTGQVAGIPVTAEYRGTVTPEGRTQHRGTVSARVGF